MLTKSISKSYDMLVILLLMVTCQCLAKNKPLAFFYGTTHWWEQGGITPSLTSKHFYFYILYILVLY